MVGFYDCAVREHVRSDVRPHVRSDARPHVRSNRLIFELYRTEHDFSGQPS